MPHEFDDEAISGVLGHMNRDHNDDNLLLVRAFGPIADATSATMLSFDGDGGKWHAVDKNGAEHSVSIAWPGGSITERREVRREIVALYDAACERLGIEPRPHA